MRLKYVFLGLALVVCFSAICFSAESEMTIDQEIAAAHSDASFRIVLHSRSVAALTGEDSWQQKDRACRILRVIGNRYSVAPLAGLLTDDKLSHMARFALEGMDYPEAGEALRDALGRTSGATKVGIIQSIGTRRDEAAQAALIGLLKSTDTDVVAAAVWAIGRLGTPDAAKAVVAFEKTAPEELSGVVFDALLTVADELSQKDNRTQAAAIYEQLARNADTDHVRMSAFAGLLAAEPKKAVGRVLGAMLSYDSAAMRNFAIAQVATLEGADVAKRFAAQLPKLQPAQQVLLIEVLAPRKDRVVRDAITEAAASKDASVRAAAAKALGDIGDTSSVVVLCGLIATGGDSVDGQAAAASLRRINADGVTAEIVKQMQTSESAAVAELIRILNDRNASTAVGAIMTAANAEDRDVRAAALRAVANLGGPEQLEPLVSLLVDLKGDDLRKDAERAVVSVSLKIENDDDRTTVVRKALASAKDAITKCSLLRVLGGIGDEYSLAEVIKAVSAADPVVRDTAIRVFAAWSDQKALPLLVKLYSDTDNQVHRVILLRGCVRLLSQGGFSNDEMINASGRLIKGVKTAQEKRLVLAVMANVGDMRAFSLVEPLLDDAQVKAEAELAVLGISRAMAEDFPQEALRIAQRLEKKSQNEQIVNQAKILIAKIRRGEK